MTAPNSDGHSPAAAPFSSARYAPSPLGQPQYAAARHPYQHPDGRDQCEARSPSASAQDSTPQPSQTPAGAAEEKG